MSIKQKAGVFQKLAQDYLKKLREIAEHADTSNELSFRPALNLFLEGLSEALGKKEMSVITEPLRKAFGTPDYKLKTGKDFIIGYIEAKGLSSDVQALSTSEQIERYCAAGQRLILTNHLEFVLYDFVLNEKESPVIRVDQVKLFDKKDLLAGKMPHPADIDSLRKLFDRFVREARPEVDGACGLAKRMANIAHIIRDSICFSFENNTASSTLRDLHKAFQEILIPDLKTHLPANERGNKIIPSFDDMYAQTIVYGLFAARCNHKGPVQFTRRMAAYDLPKTNPFLKKLFEQIAGPEIEDDPFCWAVDDLAHLLDAVDMCAVLRDFGRRSQREYPVVHFYETFLKEYDPKLRVARGVYYTPEAVVSYIVRSIDCLLKMKFNRPKGLLDENALILDPACGTGTFLYTVINHIREQFKDNKGKWSGYVEKHILPRIFGFELLMAPYAVAHMKLGLQLVGADMPEEVRNDWKYDFSGNQRLGIYLTNTLEEAFKKSEKLIASWISDEAEAAARVKKEEPIMVVLGNPPYSGHSANRSEYTMEIWQEEKWVGRGSNRKRVIITYKKPKNKIIKTWIGHLIQHYYQVDGESLGERNPKWLQDDYVKFIRFGQWRIEKTGKGILAFITNHGYLDNPTFRGMRQHLMKSFTDIYILDLHGNAKKKEKCPDGTKDENVFDIQQGVAIGIFIKEEGKKVPVRVHHAHLWGICETSDKRNGKYPYLFSHDVENTEWTELKPQAPFYLFTPQDTKLLEEYTKGWKITDIMPINSVGIVTSRDDLLFDFDETTLQARITDFLNTRNSDDCVRDRYLSKSDKLPVEKVRKTIHNDKNWQSSFTKCLYRPFDIRPLFYYETIIERSRMEVMHDMLIDKNIALLVPRQVINKFNHVFCSNKVINFNALDTAGRFGSGYLYPLYLYPIKKIEKTGQKTLFDLNKETADKQRRPNLSPAFVEDIQKHLDLKFIPNGQGNLKETFGPEDIFHYIYAVLYSPTYRTHYIEFLKIDFPRIPLTSNLNLFRELSQKGATLIALHLMEAPILEDISLQPKYPIKGSDIVEGVDYKEPGERVSGLTEPIVKGRVYINKTQYFEGIEPEVWSFHVGGYQVCQKWLKDRKGRKLSHDEITHHQKIVVALRETIRLMEEIDNAIPEWPIK